MAPAVAALVAEVVRMDEEIAEAERAQVLASIAEKFELDAKEAADLMALAEEEARAATDFYQLTSPDQFCPQHRAEGEAHRAHVAGAYADGIPHKNEGHLIRKVTELLHVPHKKFIATKLRVRGDA